MVSATGALFAVQELVWGPGRVPGAGWESLLQTLSFFWVLPFITGGLSVAGMLMQRNPRYRGKRVRPVPTLVSFRYVSRGHNVDSLVTAAESVHREMSKQPLFPHIIEVVVDDTPSDELRMRINRIPNTVFIVVPTEWETPQGSKFKARALQYAMNASSIPDDAWIMHFDEESHAHPTLIRGMASAIAEEEASGQFRIGQGCILYYHSLEDHRFLTLADSVRTGDDVGRFHLQNRVFGYPIWGMHGSFILVRNSVEKEVGFDFGPEGSVTEDAFWALCEMDRGYRSRWIDGFVVEQGTESVVDFVKQRRRWFVGLMKVVRHSPSRFLLRAPLALFTVLWSVSWIGIIYTYVNLFLGLETHPAVQTLGNLGFASFVTIYVVGLWTNLRLHQVSIGRRVLLYATQVLFVPAFALLEATGVLYGLAKDDLSFHVIRKSQRGERGGLQRSPAVGGTTGSGQ